MAIPLGQPWLLKRKRCLSYINAWPGSSDIWETPPSDRRKAPLGLIFSDFGRSDFRTYSYEFPALFQIASESYRNGYSAPPWPAKIHISELLLRFGTHFGSHFRVIINAKINAKIDAGKVMKMDEKTMPKWFRNSLDICLKIGRPLNVPNAK